MLKQHRLFELIKSLNKAEKRYFKLHAVNGKRNSNYIKLFDAIDKQTHYDEALIKSQFKGQTFIRQLHVTKNYLYQLILKSLRHFHDDSTIDIMLKEHLQTVDILFRKELLDHCETQLNKAEKLAQQYEKHACLLEILTWKRKLLLTRNAATEVQSNLDDVLQQEQQSLQKISTLNHYWSRIINIYHHHSGNCTTFRNDPLITNINHADTLQAKILFYHIHYSDNLFNHNTPNAERAISQLIEILEQYPERIREDPAAYITAINNKVSLLLHNNQMQEVLVQLNKIRTLPEQYTLDGRHPLALKSLLRTYNIELEMYCNTQQTDAGISLIETITTLLEKHLSSAPKEYFLLFYYQFAYLYFLRQNYHQSLHWLNTLLKLEFRGLREDILSFTRWLILINHYELDQLDVLKYAVDATRRFLKKKRDLHHYEQILLDFFSTLSVSPCNRHPHLFQSLNTALFESEHHHISDFVLNYLNFKQWISSKLTNSDI